MKSESIHICFLQDISDRIKQKKEIINRIKNYKVSRTLIISTVKTQKSTITKETK